MMSIIHAKHQRNPINANQIPNAIASKRERTNNKIGFKNSRKECKVDTKATR